MTNSSVVDTRTVPLEHITIVEGFNPRAAFDDAELDRLSRSLAETGILHPLIVYPTGQDDRFELGDGERRYRAAQRAGLADVPVIVRQRPADDGAELVEAIVVNLHRQAHTPMEEARAFGRLLDTGLTRKGICDRLAVTREHVRERLQLLELPEELHAGVDDGTVPLLAVKTLLELAVMHPDLPGCAARQVGREPRHSWAEPLTWADVISDPLGSITPRYADEEPELPAGVFDADHSYPLSAFTLSAKAEKDLATLVKLDPCYEDVEVAFDAETFTAAEALGTAHSSPNGCARIIVGQDVAD